MNERVKYDIQRWFGGRYRVVLLVDGYGVDRAFFDTHAEAMAWGEDKVAEKRQEVRG